MKRATNLLLSCVLLVLAFPVHAQQLTTAGDYLERANERDARQDHDGAIADYTKAIKLDPRYADAYYGRALVQQTKGNLRQAIADYNRAIKLNAKLCGCLLRPRRRTLSKGKT